MPFHVASTVGEHFTSGGGNVSFLIHTFVAATVTVCYRYQPASAPESPTTVPPTTVPPTTVSLPVAPSAVAVVAEPHTTG